MLGSTPIGPPLMVKNIITASINPDMLCSMCWEAAGASVAPPLLPSPRSGSPDIVDTNVDPSVTIELANDLAGFVVEPSVSYRSSASPPSPDEVFNRGELSSVLSILSTPTLVKTTSQIPVANFSLFVQLLMIPNGSTVACALIVP